MAQTQDISEDFMNGKYSCTYFQKFSTLLVHRELHSFFLFPHWHSHINDSSLHAWS